MVEIEYDKIPFEKLEAMETISSAQASDLKLERDNLRYWLSRVEHGVVEVEANINGSWQDLGSYTNEDFE